MFRAKAISVAKGGWAQRALVHRRSMENQEYKNLAWRWKNFHFYQPVKPSTQHVCCINAFREPSFAKFDGA